VANNEFPKSRGMRADPAIRLSDAASRQFGVVGVDDVRRAGLDKDAVRRRVEAARMHPLFPRTWAVGHRAVPREGWFVAGVLSAGEGARLAGASACQLYGIYEKRCGKVHVVRHGKPAEHGRLRIHSAKTLPPMRRRKGIPVVPIEEALLGLAADGMVADKDVRRAIRQAQVENLTTHRKLCRHVARSKGRPGVRRLRRLVGDREARTRCVLEDAALALLRRYGFDPRCNVLVDGKDADMVIGGVVVELDSEEFHDNAISAEDDAAKQAVWEAAGRRVERLTWDDVHVTPVATVRRLRAAVASAG
jgi:hypothetical protein